MSPTLRSPDRRQSEEAHYPPYPTMFGSAWSRSGQCSSGYATLPHRWPFAPAMDRGCCHLVQWLESGNPPCSRSPVGNSDGLYRRPFEELPCADLRTSSGPPAERYGLDQDPGYACHRDSASTNWYQSQVTSAYGA